MPKSKNKIKPKQEIEEALGPEQDRSFGPDRRGEDSAGATGKNRKRAVAADRDETR
jgi:hypothetical protein